MAVISMAHFMRSTAARRSAASGLIGLASGVTTVTVVQPRPLVVELLADRLVVGGVAFEERQLDAVEAGLLELGRTAGNAPR